MDPGLDPGGGDLPGAQALPVPAGGDWAALLARYRPIAVQLARGIVRSIELAEDVVQESARAVLEQAAGRGARFETPAHARNYFLRAVHNRAVNALRAPERARERSLDVAEADASGFAAPSSQLAAEEDAARAKQVERVTRALAGLRAPEREAVRLRYLESLSYKEISARTGVSISTLYSRVEAGLARIRARIGKEGGRP